MRLPNFVGVRARRLILAAGVVFLATSAVVVLRAGQQPAPAQGRSVWDGAYTDGQADRGQVAYGSNCAECHGGNLAGGEGKPLTGDVFWNDWRETTVDYLLRQISQNMPASEDGSLAGSLNPNTYADIVAHILRTNGFPAGSAELSAESARGVAIIRKEGPGPLPEGTLVQVVGCLEAGEGRNVWRITRAARPARMMGRETGVDPATVALGEQSFDLKFVVTSLQRFAGHRMAVTGLLIGEGGTGGLNVSQTRSIADTCQ